MVTYEGKGGEGEGSGGGFYIVNQEMLEGLIKFTRIILKLQQVDIVEKIL